MNENVKKVLFDYISLSETEKSELEKAISDYKKGTSIEKAKNYSDLKESFKRMTGPTSSSRCPYCGK